MTAEFGDNLIAMLPRLRRFAVSLCGRREVADDLVQAVCEKALANAARFEPGTRFDSWLFRILHNTWIDQLRRNRTEGHKEDIHDLPDLVGSHGEAIVENRMSLRAVIAAIARLPAEQREVLLLVSIEGLSYKEAAEVLNLPVGTIMSRLARARTKIADAAGIDDGKKR